MQLQIIGNTILIFAERNKHQDPQREGIDTIDLERKKLAETLLTIEKKANPEFPSSRKILKWKSSHHQSQKRMGHGQLTSHAVILTKMR